MRRASDVVLAAIIAVLSVFQLVAALVVVLLAGIACGVILFRRVLDLDYSFSEILRAQAHQRRLLTVGPRRDPGPPPLRG